jgi:hypothetical protein
VKLGEAGLQGTSEEDVVKNAAWIALSLGLIVLGGVLLAVFQRLRPEMLPAPKAEPTAPERPNRPKTRRSKG